MSNPTFKKIEKYILDKYKGCTFDNMDEAVEPDYTAFIWNLIHKYTYECYSTYSSNSEDKCTPPGRHRSAGDIFLLTKNYFPNITFKEVIKELFFLCEEKKISVLYCKDIYKLTFFKPGKYGNFWTEYSENYDTDNKKTSIDVDVTFYTLYKLYKNEKITKDDVSSTNTKPTSLPQWAEECVETIPF